MSDTTRESDHATAAGLSADELQAEQAGELPDRDAMSILDVGSIGSGLPLPSDLDGGFIGGELGIDANPAPVQTDLPAPEPPAEVGQLTDQAPLLNQVDQVLDGGTIDQAVDSRLDALPDLPTISVSQGDTIA